MNSRVQVIVETPEAIRGIVFQNQRSGYASLYVYPYQREKSMNKPLLLYRRLQLTADNHGLNDLEKWHFVKVNTAILREKAFLDVHNSKLVIEIRAGQLSPQYPAFGIGRVYPILMGPVSEERPDVGGGRTVATTIKQLATQMECLTTLRKHHGTHGDC